VKISIIGGGVGGLALAGLLDAARHDVTIFEKDSEAAFNGKYGWYDNINTNDLARLGFAHLIPRHLPEEEDRVIVSPGKANALVFRINSPGAYEPVWRPKLLAQLKADALQNAALHYGSPVQALLVENGAVKGVVTTEGELRADLVVDCSGLSALSKPLLDADGLRLNSSEFFVAYRAVYEHTSKKPAPFMDNIVLKHLGETGVGWYNVDPDGNIDVLLGRIGQLRQTTIDESLRDMQAWAAPWSALGACIQSNIYTIPVRYPLLQMVFDGYAALGDSAYMTIPMMGSGVVNALHAAKLLAKLLNKTDARRAATLWPYQTAYYKEAAPNAFAIDCLKRTALGMPNDKLELLMGAGVLSGEDIAAIFTGHFIPMTPAALLRKAPGGVKIPLVVAELGATVAKALAAEQVAKRIPQSYDPMRIAAWQQRLQGIMRSV
jgi:flavin-dependent dehydrogenase